MRVLMARSWLLLMFTALMAVTPARAYAFGKSALGVSDAAEGLGAWRVDAQMAAVAWENGFPTEKVPLGPQQWLKQGPKGLNPYQVNYWNPVRFTDPDGRNPLCAAGPMGCVVGAGVGAATGVGIYVLTTPSNERTAGGYALAAGLGMVGGGTMARGIKGAWDVGRAMMGFGAAANLGDAALAMGAAAAFVSGEGAAVNALRSAPRAGFTRFYRGTNVPTVTQVAPSARGKGGQAPAPFVPTEAEARAAAQNPQVQARSDVVSMTTDLATAARAGQYVIPYDVPNAMAAELPRPNPAQAEAAIGGSIPDAWRAGPAVPSGLVLESEGSR